jgi:hypothetical protein
LPDLSSFSAVERKADMRDAFLQDGRQTRKVPETYLEWRFAAACSARFGGGTDG